MGQPFDFLDRLTNEADKLKGDTTKVLDKVGQKLELTKEEIHSYIDDAIQSILNNLKTSEIARKNMVNFLQGIMEGATNSTFEIDADDKWTLVGVAGSVNPAFVGTAIVFNLVPFSKGYIKGFKSGATETTKLIIAILDGTLKEQVELFLMLLQHSNANKFRDFGKKIGLENANKIENIIAKGHSAIVYEAGVLFGIAMFEFFFFKGVASIFKGLAKTIGTKLKPSNVGSNSVPDSNLIDKHTGLERRKKRKNLTGIVNPVAFKVMQERLNFWLKSSATAKALKHAKKRDRTAWKAKIKKMDVLQKKVLRLVNILKQRYPKGKIPETDTELIKLVTNLEEAKKLGASMYTSLRNRIWSRLLNDADMGKVLIVNSLAFHQDSFLKAMQRGFLKKKWVDRGTAIKLLKNYFSKKENVSKFWNNKNIKNLNLVNVFLSVYSVRLAKTGKGYVIRVRTGKNKWDTLQLDHFQRQKEYPFLAANNHNLSFTIPNENMHFLELIRNLDESIFADVDLVKFGNLNDVDSIVQFSQKHYSTISIIRQELGYKKKKIEEVDEVVFDFDSIDETTVLDFSKNASETQKEVVEVPAGNRKK
ncbi:hypothetical protein [Psychroserpens sp. SPM9]|uniref:hypothetical protein n=1 Tax=Psychroserpens sp. SPM9 TaxID=2975598 RepID=UPI0021A732FB|nr:hypothetical protein [Psychroserpens sp. SPM9]MDG5492700.1 hypothetical protein [Psychroserpens sp. SPM9]